MGRMRSQLDDLIAQQAQNAPVVGACAGSAPQHQQAVYQQTHQATSYPQAMSHSPQAVQPAALQPGAPMQYAQQGYPIGSAGADVSGIRGSLERLSGKLNELTQNQNVQPNSQSRVQGNAMPDLRQEFAALRREMATLSSATANSAVGSEIFGSIKLIAEGMRQLQVLQGEQPAQFGQVSSSLQAIHSQLDQLNEAMPHDGGYQVDLAPLQDDMESNFAALGKRLEMMTADHNQIGELAQAIDGSHADIVNRLHALAEHSPADNVSDMRSQLQNIGETLAGLSSAGGGAQGNDLEQIDKRLDEITHGMVALSVNINEGSSQEALERVEARVNTLAKTIDTFVAEAASSASGDGDGKNSETLHVLNSLTGHIDVLSEKIDGLIAIPVGTVGEQSAIVRNDDGIIKKLDELVSRMDDLQASGSGTGEEKHLAALEKQLNDISSHLGSGGGGAVDFSRLDERLDTIEQQVAVSRDIAIEVASKVAGQAANNAAIQAVNETFERANIGGEQASGATIDASIYQDIADDIRKLQDSSQSQNADNRQVFDSVRGSLNTIIARLGDIEGLVATNGKNTPAARQVLAAQLEAKSQTLSSAGGEDVQHSNKQARAPLVTAKSETQNTEEGADPVVEPVRAQKPSSEASGGQEIMPPSLDMKDLPEVDDTPMEPGSGGPDLAALVEQANQRRKDEPVTVEVAGTDFIAAARRAAQAAALEANAAEADEKSQSKSKGTLSLSDFFARRKKVVLMTAAAVLIAAMAVPIATAFLNGDGVNKIAGFGQSEEQTAVTPVSRMMEQAPIANIDNEHVGSISKHIESGDGKNTTTLMKAPDSAMLLNEKMPSSEFAVGNSMVDSSRFKAEMPMDMAAKVGTAITQAPMPPSNVGNIQLRQAAASGNLSALFEIGRIYTDGNGVERDLTEAAKWYRLAAERGHGPAQYRLGNFFEKGHGMARDIDEAMVWYRLSAKQGNALAMHNLAVVSAMGTELAKADLGIAAGWFEKAADLGIKDSQVNLGILYTKGLGVEKNLVTAYKWFGVASRAGDSDASSKRDTVSGLMTQEQLELGRAEIELWKKTSLDDNANFVEVPNEWKGNALANGQQSMRDTIRDTQVLLSKLGFDAGPADGMMGAKTRNAVMAFQQRAGMTVDGKISTGLIAKLKSGAA
ncbi:MAG: SEL1-like repeat protein [Rhizobiaceae bacterium]|nr:SEL1-like repeat protein [Rhizobiaceae bacterium]